METEAKQFVQKLSLFCLIIIGTAILLYISVLKPYYVKSFPLQFMLIGSFTALSHLKLIKALEKNIRVFTSVFILSITMKLMLYFFFLLVCLLIDNSKALYFVLTFFVLYISFTAFEVIQLLNVKKN